MQDSDTNDPRVAALVGALADMNALCDPDEPLTAQNFKKAEQMLPKFLAIWDVIRLVVITDILIDIEHFHRELGYKNPDGN